MFLVLDASALLSGSFNSIPSGFEAVFITSRVKDEVSKGSPARKLDQLISAGLSIRDPRDTSGAEKASSGTGDLGSLSDADLSVIALAMELGNAVVMTDDFMVQNVLKSLGIRFESAGELGARKISEVWKWTFRCLGCGRFFEEAQKEEICPICGSNVKKKRKR
ncbi:MAG: NOB1 family endonuclease [Thermoplasmatota archaeon]